MKAGPREYNHYYRRRVWLLPFETDFQLPQGPCEFIITNCN